MNIWLPGEGEQRVKWMYRCLVFIHTFSMAAGEGILFRSRFCELHPAWKQIYAFLLGQYQCDVCGNYLTKKSLSRHRRDVHQAPIRCPVIQCSRVCGRFTQFKDHVEAHMKENYLWITLQCGYCKTKFKKSHHKRRPTKEELKRFVEHMRQCDGKWASCDRRCGRMFFGTLMNKIWVQKI